MNELIAEDLSSCRSSVDLFCTAPRACWRRCRLQSAGGSYRHQSASIDREVSVHPHARLRVPAPRPGATGVLYRASEVRYARCCCYINISMHYMVVSQVHTAVRILLIVWCVRGVLLSINSCFFSHH